MSLFTEGLDYLETKRLQFMSDPALYRRGADELKINATPGKSLFRATDRNGVTIVIRSEDFIVAASELLSLGVPKRGDLILFNGGRYEVLNPNGEPCWQWSDVENQVYRIHTKSIGAES